MNARTRRGHADISFALTTQTGSNGREQVFTKQTFKVGTV